MAMEANNKSFTWKISPLSKSGLGMRKSETFHAGGCQWVIVAYIREDPLVRDDWVISLFLRCCSDMGRKLYDDGGRRDRFAKYVFTVSTPGGGANDSLNLIGEGKRHFTGPATPDSGYDTDYDDQEQDSSWDADTHQDEDTSSDSDYYNQEGDSSLSSGADTDQEEDALDDDDATADESEHIEPDDQPNGASIEKLANHECLSGQTLAAAWEAYGGVQTTQLSTHQVGCPYPDPLSSKSGMSSCNLIAELSTMLTLNTKSLASGNGSSTLLLQQHKETMARYLNMPLEAIHKTDSFDNVELLAKLIADHPSAEVDKEILKGLLSELKAGIPSTMSVIESSRVTEASMGWKEEDLEARLFHRHRQLGCLKVEVSRLEEEEKKLEGDIQQLIARKARVGVLKKSTADELEKASLEATKEMEEMKETSSKRKRACVDKLAAEDELCRLKRSWKALKQTLKL
ncbi:unnamed protein product [Linum tenue]|uniref:MATH domain-containing protein n=1 Tax=Linum tenue TaxID=586396 RepID=A0AAV0IYP7_9ROSI|nr:unnamed protein product [Linum tenue]